MNDNTYISFLFSNTNIGYWNKTKNEEDEDEQDIGLANARVLYKGWQASVGR